MKGKSFFTIPVEGGQPLGQSEGIDISRAARGNGYIFLALDSERHGAYIDGTSHLKMSQELQRCPIEGDEVCFIPAENQTTRSRQDAGTGGRAVLKMSH